MHSPHGVVIKRSPMHLNASFLVFSTTAFIFVVPISNRCYLNRSSLQDFFFILSVTTTKASLQSILVLN